MDFKIKGRLALVTGASRGIGRGIATELANEGARVILVARSKEALEATRLELPNPDSHFVLAADLMADGGVQQVADAVAALGDLDIMVHNLGGSAMVFPVFAPSEEWQKVWQFNVGIGHELNRLLIPQMVERKWGRVIHISTLAAMTGKGYAAYSSAKAALNGYVRAVNREVSRHNVILSAVAPGAVRIEGRHFDKVLKENPAGLDDYFKNNQPIHRLGKIEEVAAVVTFLCSEQAAFMAGSIVGVDGGGF
jgi:3-oxoacyl-[acyl-carrier protein] reductase